MDWTWLAIAVVLAYLLRTWLKKKTLGRKLPPGPRGLPILGHLHLLSKNPHQDLQKLAEKHGPIMSMRFGFVPNVIVSSPQAAEQFLKTYDLNFAGRPPLESAKYISYGQINLSFSTYGPYWRNMRKLCTLDLLSNHKINSFEAMRMEELELLVEYIKNAAQERTAIDLGTKVSSMISDMTCRMIFGKRFDDKDLKGRGFQTVIQEGMQLATAFNLGDYFPYLGVLDLQGMTKKLKAIAELFDNFLEKILDDHEQSKEDKQTKDFVDTMLDIMRSGEAEFEFGRAHVKATLLVVHFLYMCLFSRINFR